MTTIHLSDINKFYITSSRSSNDTVNKLRESIISATINNKLPEQWYTKIPKWMELKNNIASFFKNIYGDFKKIKLIKKAGRKHNFDFIIKVDGKKHDWEWKFGASCISECPQFVSPMKPSQYFNINFEQFFYENYLIKLCHEFNLHIPDKTTYINGIHSNNPSCVNHLQETYYQGCSKSSQFTNELNAINFYNKAKQYSKQGITEFLQNAILNTSKLTYYFLTKNQANKNYILCKNNTLYYDKLEEKNLKIIQSSLKLNDKKNGYICNTESGIQLNILLRWKNGNGIAYPAFQIKQQNIK